MCDCVKGTASWERAGRTAGELRGGRALRQPKRLKMTNTPVHNDCLIGL